MKNIKIKYILDSKFIILTTIIFVTLGIMSNTFLSTISPYYNISIFDSYIVSFNYIENIGISTDEIKVLSIFLGILYISSDFINRYINSTKYLYVIRTGNSIKYIKQLLRYSYFISIVYFLLGYIIILLINIKFNIDEGLLKIIYKDSSYTEIIICMFIMSNLITISLINLNILISIKFKKNISGLYISSLTFLIAVLGNIKFLPGFNIYLYRNLNEDGRFKIASFIFYIIIIIYSNFKIEQSIKKDKDFLLYNYEL